jgi:hypothetical protein
MRWRYARHSAEHALPIGASERAAVGQTVRAGDALAAGARHGIAIRVAGARRIGVAVDDVARVMRVPVGAEVERGQILARTGRRFARAATAPVDGRLIHLRTDGDFEVAPILGKWVVRSTLDGSVTRSDDAVVAVEGEAWCLQGAAGYGPDAVGEIALAMDGPAGELVPNRIDTRMAGRILVGGARSAAEAITRAHACGVGAVVAGAVPAVGLRAVYGPETTARSSEASLDVPTVLCLIGFGATSLPIALYEPLAAMGGLRAAVHSATARLFVFAPPAEPFGRDEPSFVLASDWSTVRPVEEHMAMSAATRFPSEFVADALAAPDGPVPVANVKAG